MADRAHTNALPSNPTQHESHTHHEDHDPYKQDPDPRDRDSGIFLSDNEDPRTPSRPTSLSSNYPSSPSKTPLSRTSSTARRLRRPAELNLSSPATPDPAKPKSELELRYDLIRNSQTQSKAALKSPTQLLKDRLNLSPKKEQHEDRARVFTPPQPMLNGCILPGPAAQMQAFAGGDVRARTEGGRPPWWCKFDRLVVFDGVEEGNIRTRSSKGLSIARRRGDAETVLIPLDCAHCQEMLNRREWKYDVQVCRRGVCWDCRERCRWEVENPVGGKEERGDTQAKAEANRIRADSVLQEEQVQEEELMAKLGIESAPRTPIEIVGGIEERLETGEVEATG